MINQLPTDAEQLLRIGEKIVSTRSDVPVVNEACPGYDTKQHRAGRLEFWSSGSIDSPVHCMDGWMDGYKWTEIDR